MSFCINRGAQLLKHFSVFVNFIVHLLLYYCYTENQDMKKQILILVICSVAATVYSTKKSIVCYYATWATYRLSIGKYAISDIDATLCTHLIYAFIGVFDNGTIHILDPWLDIDSNELKDFVALRNSNPSTKIMVSMGGWNEGSLSYSTIVTNGTLRATFVDNVYEFLKKYDFDGFDLDWEYPGKRGGLSSNKRDLIYLLKELNTKLKKDNLLLSVAVAPTEKSADISYNIPEIAKNVDFISLMTYDYHTSDESVVGHNTPLYAARTETGENKKLNIDTSVKHWISQYVPLNKLMMGLAFYGKSYTLKDPKVVGRGAPSAGAGVAGPYTRANGSLAYYEICDLIKNKNWKVINDTEQHVPYAYSYDQIVAFDDVASLEEKVVYIKKHHLGGAMIYSIDTDDFQGSCGEKNPLLKTVNKILRNWST
ncbi:acidic mammalian chitinase-like [Belonocnema kinseyi]|uniref:acidic mammalian chitinase-like n=1 Tax=Belonocnema kinseyi TaxID=2817044 RepID=UPI00143DDEFC|nr:acidic mammalian chitinase-like [Belonocnema kinseyi]